MSPNGVHEAEPSPGTLPYFRHVQVTFWCPDDPIATLVHDSGATVTPLVLRFDADGGQVLFRLPSDLPAPFGAELTLKADGFQRFTHRFALRDFSVFDAVHDNANVRTQLP